MSKPKARAEDPPNVNEVESVRAAAAEPDSPLNELFDRMQVISVMLSQPIDRGFIWGRPDLPLTDTDSDDELDRLSSDERAAFDRIGFDGNGDDSDWDGSLVRSAKTLPERLYVARKTFKRLMSITTTAIGRAEGLSSNPLVFDAYVCLKAVLHLLETGSCYAIGPGDDEAKVELMAVTEAAVHTHATLYTPLLLASMKVSIAAGGNLPGIRWSRYRSPKQWRLIFAKLEQRHRAIPHSTFKRQIQQLNVDQRTTKSWRFDLRQLPDGYVDNDRGYLEANNSPPNRH